VIPSAKVIKNTARSQLRKHWVAAMIVAVLFLISLFFFFMLFGFMSGFFASGKGVDVFLIVFVALYGFCLLCTLFPLFQGVLRWYWFLGLDKKLPVSEIFYFFSDRGLHLRSTLLGTALLCRTVITALVCIAPALLLRFLPELMQKILPELEFSEATLNTLSYNLMIGGLVLALILLMKYFTAPAILVINAELNPDDVLRISRELSLSKGSLFVFIASFIPWILLSFLGITLAYTLPYFFMSYAVAVRFAVTNHRYDAARWGAPPLI